MTNKEKLIIDKLISRLDEVTGKLLVPSMMNNSVMDIMNQVVQINIELGDLL